MCAMYNFEDNDVSVESNTLLNEIGRKEVPLFCIENIECFMLELMVMHSLNRIGKNMFAFVLLDQKPSLETLYSPPKSSDLSIGM